MPRPRGWRRWWRCRRRGAPNRCRASVGEAWPARRAAAGKPVCGGPGARLSRLSTGRRRRRASARASNSAGSNPRARRWTGVVGAHVITAPSISGKEATASAIRAASQGTTARTLRYLTRATSSRAAPSYANGAHQASTPTGGATRGAAPSAAAHAGHSGRAPRAGWPQPGHASGNRTLSTRSRYD